MISLTAAAIFFLPLCPGEAYSKIVDLGQFGEIYEIAEKDALLETEQLAAKFNFEEYKKNLNDKIESYRPKTADLPRAGMDTENKFELEHVLERDVLDKDGNIIYPKGYRYNPLQYTANNKTYVVINGSDPAQVDWLKKSAYAKAADATVLITDGDPEDVAQKIKKKVYFAVENVVRVFRLSSVPSVVKQDGKYLKVKEILIR